MDAAPEALERFVLAQQPVHARALAELHAGRKQTHWMWFVLPQLASLGHSPMARTYGIADLAEARQYLAHPVLGPRLIECVDALLGHPGRSAADMLGEVDAMKLRSCLTLFAQAAPAEPCFAAALARFYGGRPDEATLRLLGRAPDDPGA